MKIGLVRRGYSKTGGAEAYLRRFATAMAVAGHQSVLFATKDWPAKEWPYERQRVKHGKSPLDFALDLESMQPSNSCDFLFSLERVLACDCYRAGDGVHAVWLERRAKFEPVWKTWWRNRRDKHHELLRLEETMFRGEAARSVIANSQMVKDEIIRQYGYPDAKCHVVYNGAPPALAPEEAAKARTEVRRELGLDDRDYMVLFAGSGWDRKGLRYAVQAINEAAISNPTLVVAGKGRRSGIPRSTRTRYVGPVPGLGRWLAAADAFILPTLYDPFSNACLEALAAGLPVITTTANGFAEIIKDGIEGEIVEDPRDILALAKAIERWAPLEKRAAIRQQLREKGARFSMEENVRKTLEVIESVRGPWWATADAATGAGSAK